jgi:hypothetical protein
MSRVNHEEEIIITGKVRPRMIKSKVNSVLGGKFWRINYPEEKVWGKDGAKPLRGSMKFFFKQMLKVSSFYHEKQKKFYSKKNII